MDLRAYLTTLRRSWLLLVVPVVVALIAAVVVLGATTPKYASTANVYVSVGNASNANDLSQANAYAQSAAANFAALAEQPYVLFAVRKQLGLPLTSDEIAEEITTTVQEGTSIISIEVLDASAARAARIADATAAQLATAVSVLNPSAADGTQAVRLTVVRTASVADSASVPNRPLGLAVGLLAGLLLGVVLVILRELLDTRLRSAEDLQQITGAPVVGRIARTPSIADHPLVIAHEPGSAAAEGFRRLQLNLEYLRAPHGVVTVGIASAVPSEGKSTVAANLAVALAAGGHRVALVDADLRRPRLHTTFGLEDSLGLTEVLVGRVDVFDVVQAWGPEHARIAVVPAGSIPPNPGELLQSPRLRAAFDRLAEEADVVIVDGPPLLAVADSAVLARTVDAVLLVASLRRSHRTAVARALGELQNVGARVLGSVVTMVNPPKADSDAYLRYQQRRQVAGPAEPPVEQVSADAVMRTEWQSTPEADAPTASTDAPSGAATAGSGAERRKPTRRRPAVEASVDAPSEEPASLDGVVAEEASSPGGSPVRVLTTHEADTRQLKASRKRLSDEELRVLRSFSKRDRG